MPVKLCYCTNIWSHHQGNVCREFAKILGDDFKMCLVQPLSAVWSQERIKLGWNLTPPDENWIVGPPETDTDIRFIANVISDADVAIIGISPFMPNDVLKNREQNNKITFIMGERFFKTPRKWHHYLNPRALWRWVSLHLLLNPPSFHYLTMNHYCADDLRFLRVCRGRIWTWGYLINVTTDPPQKRYNQKMKVMWCGRMLKLKQVDLLLHALSLIPMEQLCKLEVSIIGDGECLREWQSLMEELDLSLAVRFEPPKKHAEILEALSSTDVYVFPSNRMEGWGATLLEAMDKGCVVVANREAGATLEVVDHGKNGWVFNDGDVAALANCISWCLINGNKRTEMGFNAWKTLQDWSPFEGARRFIALAERIKVGVFNSPYTNGLCSQKR